jgi:hypothetical protein
MFRQPNRFMIICIEGSNHISSAKEQIKAPKEPLGNSQEGGKYWPLQYCLSSSSMTYLFRCKQTPVPKKSHLLVLYKRRPEKSTIYAAFLACSHQGLVSAWYDLPE